jgi:mitochondrial import inner membrane translocase subunit TIM9
VRLYNWVSQRCFSDCVATFYRKRLGKGEADCVRACVRKYLHLTTATAARFADLAGTGSADEEA